MAVIWSTTDKTANVTVSSLLATASTAAQGGVRANTSFASGKLYYEVTLGATNGSTTTGIGWANAAASLTAFFGSDKNGHAVYPGNGTPSNIVFNGAGLGSLGIGWFTGQTMCIAFDITNKLIWYKIPGRPWNNNPSADPGTGTGGLSVSTILAGPYFPAFGPASSGTSITANFGATPFQSPIPSGFSAVDPTTQAYAASSKFLGYVIDGPPQNAMSASKLLGYVIDGPPTTALAASKLLGYAIITNKTASYSRQRQYVYLRE